MGVDILLAWPGLAWPGQLKGPERAMLEIERVGGARLHRPQAGGTHIPSPTLAFCIEAIPHCQLRRGRFLG